MYHRNVYKGGGSNIFMKVKCKHCGHEWETESKNILVTCSSCGKKTPNYKKLPKSKNIKEDIKKEIKNDILPYPKG